MGACGRWLLDGYLPRHPRLDGTEVGISSCGREGIGEALSRLQDRRLFELIDNNLSLDSLGRRGFSCFGLPTAGSAEKCQSNEQNERQSACIHVSQKRRKYRHASSSPILVVNRRSWHTGSLSMFSFH